MTPRRTRQLLEACLDSIGWIWHIRLSRWIDSTLIEQENDEAGSP